VRARLVVGGLVLAGAIFAGVSGGLGGLVVFAFFVLLAAGLAWAAGAGGGWLERASRSRFDDDRRRDP
jgi:hypothetical protein